LKTFSICSSSSVRSVMMRTRELATFSRIHFASHTMVQALARALRVPDDAALAGADMLLRGADAEILIMAAGLLGARVEHDEVVEQFEEPLLAADMDQVAVEGLLGRPGLPPAPSH
jgi:hypothetical protein